MKSSIAVLFVIGFAYAVAFPGVIDPGVSHGGGSYGILTANGSYKPGNFIILIFKEAKINVTLCTT